eukprot:scaffold11840_cov41-Cyclotella_meneghiniana.AAC.2
MSTATFRYDRPLSSDTMDLERKHRTDQATQNNRDKKKVTDIRTDSEGKPKEMLRLQQSVSSTSDLPDDLNVDT